MEHRKQHDKGCRILRDVILQEPSLSQQPCFQLFYKPIMQQASCATDSGTRVAVQLRLCKQQQYELLKKQSV
ncbi:hypothetical protein FGO68_gene15519 [Halteria grandinella]|uniref:Uncharacterized protein n=1 Tax=Halteria grandinella TaxID=5974 RepID=A0A8J8T8Q5_HALGN|nr:hypothetical protein FGO68_gene15519 [Halteria grandinella]